jgi:hypothetical protein
LAICVFNTAVNIPLGPETVGMVTLKTDNGRLNPADKSPVLFTRIDPGPFVITMPVPAVKYPV